MHPDYANFLTVYHVFSPDLSSLDLPYIPEPATTFTPSFSFSSTKEVLDWRREGREGDSSSQNPVLQYLTQMLMEEENENMTWEDKDQLALRDTELSLYQVLGDQEYTPPLNQTGGRKNHREERDLEEEIRSAKRPTILVKEDSELHELVDKILLFNSKPAGGSKGGKSGNKRQVKEDSIDVKDLLIPCARAVFFSDHKTSSQLLKQIREHASPVGDGSQRLAHYFANGLEARIKGSGTRIQDYNGTLASMHTSSADVMKAIDCIFTALPYELSIRYANKVIYKMAENAKALHIVDFGNSFGFQWPDLIELLSKRDGGPPELRFTVIEFLQRGFRPSARAEETRNLLACYCERFNVLFEFNCIKLQDWKTLKTDRNEIVVANNLYRFESLLDETDDNGVECPRDAVLRIIRSMNPDIFVHSVINGSFNGRFFVTRFKDALSYYSSIFDALDTVANCEDLSWLMYESQYYGPEIMNVVACEGAERIFRPESYKQWQVRNIKAGFKPLPLDQELIQGLREQLKTRHHKHFSFDEDGPWILQSWKGRTTNAWSFWVRGTPHL